MKTLRFLFTLLLAVTLVTSSQAQVTVPNTLVAGSTIRANELNTNFGELGTKSLNRITGGQLEGNVIVLTDVTIDGVDLSDFLISTALLAPVAGSAGAPSIALTTDTDTGLYFPASDSLAIALGGTQRFLLNASGLTIFGTNIINASGKIPAISSTYFASLDGSALTGISSGISVADPHTWTGIQTFSTNPVFNAGGISEASIADANVLARLGGTDTVGGTWTFTPGIKERGRSTFIGAWDAVTFSAGNFTASTGSWTVASGDQTVFSYTLVGKTMTVSLTLENTDTSSDTSEIRVAIPGSFTAARVMNGAALGLNDNFTFPVRWDVAASGTYIRFRALSNGGNYVTWKTGNPVDVFATITFEVN